MKMQSNDKRKYLLNKFYGRGMILGKLKEDKKYGFKLDGDIFLSNFFVVEKENIVNNDQPSKSSLLNTLDSFKRKKTDLLPKIDAKPKTEKRLKFKFKSTNDTLNQKIDKKDNSPNKSCNEVYSMNTLLKRSSSLIFQNGPNNTHSRISDYKTDEYVTEEDLDCSYKKDSVNLFKNQELKSN